MTLLESVFDAIRRQNLKVLPPNNFVRKDWLDNSGDQEANMSYVAVTRAAKTLNIHTSKV